MGPNGQMIYAVGCSGWGRTMEDCKKDAHELCPDGQGTISLASGADNVSPKGGIGDQPAQKLAVECKLPSP